MTCATKAAVRWHEAGVDLNAIAMLLGRADLGQLRICLGIEGDDAMQAHRQAFVALDAARAAAGIEPEIVTIRGRDGKVSHQKVVESTTCARSSGG